MPSYGGIHKTDVVSMIIDVPPFEVPLTVGQKLKVFVSTDIDDSAYLLSSDNAIMSLIDIAVVRVNAAESETSKLYE